MTNRINKIVNNIEFKRNKIYLLEYIDDNNGFLLNDNSVWFISKNFNKISVKNIQTQYLNLRTNLHITGVDETTYFKPDYYNVIIFKDYLETDLLNIFVSLCNTFVQKINEITFEYYFEILIDLFQIETKEGAINLLGLLGELLFIKQIFQIDGLDLSPYWHIISNYDRHDFSLPSFSIEVKTTLKPDLRFLIKHSQIITDQNVFIVLIRVAETGNGQSLSDIVTYFNNTSPFNQNLKFLFSLNAALSKLTKANYNDIKYYLVDTKFYFNRELCSIADIPNHITSISYKFDFSGQREVPYDHFIGKLKTYI